MHRHVRTNSKFGEKGDLSRSPLPLRGFNPLRPLFSKAFAFGCNFVALEGGIRIRKAVLSNWLMDVENLRLAPAAANATNAVRVSAYTRAAYTPRGIPGTFVGVFPVHPSTSSASTRSVIDNHRHRGVPGTPINIYIGTIRIHSDTRTTIGRSRAIAIRPNTLAIVQGMRVIALVPLRRLLHSMARLVEDGLANKRLEGLSRLGFDHVRNSFSGRDSRNFWRSLRLHGFESI